MNIDKAYATLGDVVPETEDDLLWMAYEIAVSFSSSSYICLVNMCDLPLIRNLQLEELLVFLRPWTNQVKKRF